VVNQVSTFNKAVMSTSVDSPYVIFCGAGASGTGLLVAAAQHGFLEAIAERGGIVAFEKSNNTGGMLANTRIPSNSFASVFTECLPGLKKYFGEDCPQIKELEASEEVSTIVNVGKEALELTIVGSFLKKLGSVIWDRSSQISKCELNLEHEIIAIKVLGGDNGLEVTARSSQGIVTVRKSKKVLISMGGIQNLDVIETIPIHKTITMAMCRSKLVVSHTVVQRPDLVTQMLLSNVLTLKANAGKKTEDGEGKQHAKRQKVLRNKISAKNPVVIVGGSHSAWAAAFNLIDKISKDVDFENGSIVILHRSPIRMYYGSLAEAQAAGYKIDPAKDVCPLTGRVNRYGGLRYHVNTLAKTVVLSGTEKRIRTVHIGAQAGEAAIKQLFDDAVLVVAAIGYAARVPNIVDADGKKITLHSSFGQLTTNPKGQCSTQEGSLLPDILAYGLGAGQFTNPDVGGEESFAGRVDGVWLYMNDMGKVLLRTLTE
jgi:hypothetical protein